MSKLINCSTELWEFRKLSVIKVTIIRYDNPNGETDESADLSKEVYYYSDYCTAEKEVYQLLKDWETHVYNGNPVKFVNAYNSDSKKVFRHEVMANPSLNYDMLSERPVCVQTNEITIETIDVDNALELNNQIKRR